MADTYYWLKFQENFFDDDQMIYLESLKNGYKYIVFWQKLLLRCLKNQDNKHGCCFLRFSEKLPYKDELLAKITRMDIDTVRVAIKIFQDLDMIEILSDGTIYIEAVNKLMGRQSSSTERVRRYRAKKKLLEQQNKLRNDAENSETPVTLQNVTSDVSCNYNEDEEEELELEIDEDESNVSSSSKFENVIEEVLDLGVTEKQISIIQEKIKSNNLIRPSPIDFQEYVKYHLNQIKFMKSKKSAKLKKYGGIGQCLYLSLRDNWIDDLYKKQLEDKQRNKFSIRYKKEYQEYKKNKILEKYNKFCDEEKKMWEDRAKYQKISIEKLIEANTHFITLDEYISLKYEKGGKICALN